MLKQSCDRYSPKDCDHFCCLICFLWFDVEILRTENNLKFNGFPSWHFGVGKRVIYRLSYHSQRSVYTALRQMPAVGAHGVHLPVNLGYRQHSLTVYLPHIHAKNLSNPKP